MSEQRPPYPTDLTDEQWATIEHLFAGMRVYKCSKRELMNAVLYLVKTGCQWRQLPHDFPPWKTVYSFFRRASLNGLIDTMLYELVGITRMKAGRSGSPSYAIVDSQSVKTVSASEKRGFDGGKKIKGRKRHIAVDVMGNLLGVMVHKANLHDTKTGYYPALEAITLFPTIEKFCGDAGYKGTFIDEIEEEFNIGVDIYERSSDEVWEVLPKRWVVERTFAWLNPSRRLSKDYEIKSYIAEAMIKLSHLHVLLKRL